MASLSELDLIQLKYLEALLDKESVNEVNARLKLENSKLMVSIVKGQVAAAELRVNACLLGYQEKYGIDLRFDQLNQDTGEITEGARPPVSVDAPVTESPSPPEGKEMSDADAKGSQDQGSEGAQEAVVS